MKSVFLNPLTPLVNNFDPSKGVNDSEDLAPVKPAIDRLLEEVGLVHRAPVDKTPLGDARFFLNIFVEEGVETLTLVETTQPITEEAPKLGEGQTSAAPPPIASGATKRSYTVSSDEESDQDINPRRQRKIAEVFLFGETTPGSQALAKRTKKLATVVQISPDAVVSPRGDGAHRGSGGIITPQSLTFVDPLYEGLSRGEEFLPRAKADSPHEDLLRSR